MCRVCQNEAVVTSIKKVQFSKLVKNRMVQAMPMSVICDIAHCLEANPTPIFNKGGCGLETYADDGTPSEAGYILCPAVKKR